MEDYQLIRLFLDDKDEQAFEILLNRHIGLTKSIVYKHCRSLVDVDDLIQQIWVKIIDALPTYRDEDKFPAYISIISMNTIRDYWRHQNVRKNTDNFTDLGDERGEFDPAVKDDIDSQYDNSYAVNYLMTDLIPNLPCELRTVFLLRHESEYWDGKKRLDWHMIGLLTGQDEEGAWQSFDKVRKQLKRAYDGQSIENTLTCTEICTFLLWTQSQRPIKEKKVTEIELSQLIGIPVNTFKTKYRKAKKLLLDAMEKNPRVQWQ